MVRVLQSNANKAKGSALLAGDMRLPASTSIVEMRRIGIDEAKRLEQPVVKKREMTIKHLRTFFGEALARCLLLGACGALIWRLSKSFPDFPVWGYLLLSIGILLSLGDCLQSSWYKSKLYGYWHFYKYVHWNGRVWLEPNTLFCLLTIIPTLACIETSILWMNETANESSSSVSEDTTTLFPPDLTNTVVNYFETTTVEYIGSGGGSSSTIPDSNSSDIATTSSSLLDNVDASLLPLDRNESATTQGNTSGFTMSNPTTSGNIFVAEDIFIPWGREISLFALHHLIYLLLVLNRLQVRLPDNLHRMKLNLVLFEFLLNAVDLDSFIINGLNERIVQTDYNLFISVMVFWAIGFIPLLLLLSRRYEMNEFESDRNKLETLYSSIIIVLQDAPRLALRLYIIIQSYRVFAIETNTNILFFAGKNIVSIILYIHRILVLKFDKNPF